MGSGCSPSFPLVLSTTAQTTPVLNRATCLVATLPVMDANVIAFFFLGFLFVCFALFFNQ